MDEEEVIDEVGGAIDEGDWEAAGGCIATGGAIPERGVIEEEDDEADDDEVEEPDDGDIIPGAGGIIP